jgi:universal stress protein A
VPEIRRILVPTDFSAASERALEFAASLAQHYHASLELLHVQEDPIYTAMYPDAYFADIEGLRQQLTRDAERSLADIVTKHPGVQGRTTSRVIIGRPASVILEQSANGGADLIVMGTHGRSGFAHLMLGSVAERVIRSSTCPVLTVREADGARR